MTLKRIVLGALYCMCALMLVLGIYAQQPTTTQPVQPVAALQTYHAVTPAYTYQTEIRTGMNIDGYPITPTTTLDTVVMNDAGAIAMTAHQLSGGTGSDHTAVLTPKKLIAQEGQVIDNGKTIVRIATAVLAINNAGNVAWEALWRDSASGNKVHTGIFLGAHYVTDFPPFASGAATDFELSDDDHVLLKNLPSAPAKRPLGLPGLLRDIYPLENALERTFAPRKDWLVIWGATRSGEAVTGTIASRPAAAAKPLDKAANDPSAAAVLPASASTCKLPSSILPPEWLMGADISGPVASHAFDAPAKPEPYDSPVYGRLASPFRQLQFSSDCKALIVIVGDRAARGRYEIATPAGLLTYAAPDGHYVFPGVSERVTSGPFLKADVVYRVSRRGQLLLPVKLDPEGFALLLATPVNGAN